jgi:hypothetical protein
MTRIQQEYYKYLEQKRHDMEMERLTGEAQAEAKRANLERERNARVQTAQQGQLTAAQVSQIANSIRQKDVELSMKADMNKWQKSVDRFNQDLAKQKQSLDNSKLEFEKTKWGDTQSNWLKQYDLDKGKYNIAKKNYELALKQFKLDKTDKTWKNVLSTAKTVSDIVNNATKSRNDTLKTAISVLRAGGKGK